MKLHVIMRLAVGVVLSPSPAFAGDDLGVRGRELHPRRRHRRDHGIDHRRLGHLGRSLIAKEAAKASHRLGMKLIDARFTHAEDFADFLKG